MYEITIKEIDGTAESGFGVSSQATPVATSIGTIGLAKQPSADLPIRVIIPKVITAQDLKMLIRILGVPGIDAPEVGITDFIRTHYNIQFGEP